jgi:predicted RecA/RadA family phage recombinase
MKNFIQPGQTVTLPAPYDVISGACLKLGAIVGVAAHDAAAGAEVETMLTGVHDLAKAPSQAWAVGAKIYWDDTNKVTTTTATSNTMIGVALLPVAGGASDTIGRIRLNGAF